MWANYLALGEELIDLIPLHAEIVGVEAREEPGTQSPNPRRGGLKGGRCLQATHKGALS